MSVLVTGSAGFVGKNLVDHLTKNQVPVMGLDKTIAVGSFRYRLGSYETDLAGFLRENHINSVIHLASESHVDRSISGPREFIENNIQGTLELFEAVKKANREIPIVLFSTDEVGACLPSGSFFEKGQVFKCGSTYSASKGAQELLAQAYANTFDLHVVTTRCVNIFGRYQASEKFIPTVVRNAVADIAIPIYGNGMQLRQWIPVTHVCKVLNDLAISTCIPPDSVIHIAGTHEVPNVLLAHTILNLLNKPSSLISYVKDRLGHDVRYSLGVSEETERFGIPNYDVSDFMTDLGQTVQWYADQWKAQRGGRE